MFKKILFSISFLFLVSISYGQSIDKISRRCKPPNGGVVGSVLFNINGDINQTPCPTRTNFFFGNVDFSGATVIGTGFISGSGTANFIPRFTASSVLGNTPNSWDGTSFVWSDTPLTAVGTMTFQAGTTAINYKYNLGTTASTLGIDVNNKRANAIMIGNVAGNTNNGGILYDTANGVQVIPFGTTVAQFGNTSTVGVLMSQTLNTMFVVAPTLDWSDATLGGVGIFKLKRTVTAGGTTGNQTINKPNGTVNFAAGATTITISNTTVTATSQVLVTGQRKDATCVSWNVNNKGANTFDIVANAACTAETSVAFWVLN